jgi:hypothetical protein
MARVIITMPAYRAEATLEKTVADIPPAIADELILVDDASPDNTAEIARSLGISVHVHPQNRGYGGNQKTCYTMALESGADVVVMLHPDYQYEPKSAPLLIAPILAGEADMTFGSRFAGLGDPRAGGMPTYRYLGNRITTMLENLLLGSRFTEMHSGMRAYTRRCLLSLPFLGYSEDFGFDSQFLVDAITSGLRVVEVPIPARYTKESSSIGIGRSLKYVAQSLLYATRQSAARGRRGRRYPVAGRSQPTTGQVFAAPIDDSSSVGPRDDQDPKWEVDPVVRKLESYFLPGRRVAFFGTGAERVSHLFRDSAEGVDILPQTGSSTDVFDVAVFTDPLEKMQDAVSILHTALSRLHEAGLAVLFLLNPGPKKRDSRFGERPSWHRDHNAVAAVHHLLGEAGLRMVEWERPGRAEATSGRPVVMVARRQDQVPG